MRKVGNAAGDLARFLLPLKARTMREATTQHYYHLLVFSGCSDRPQDSDWHFLPRYDDLAQAGAIAIFLRGDMNVIRVSGLSGESRRVRRTRLFHVTLNEARA
jgi:hypothetical protein